MSKLKVVHLTSVHPPFDNRIFHKECKTLSAAGYDVVLVAPHIRTETVDSIRIHAVKKPKNRIDRLTKTTFLVLQAALKEKASCYHIHDPELLFVGVLLKMRGCNVIYDVHEDYVQSIRQKPYLPKILKYIGTKLTELFEPLVASLFNVVIAERYYRRRFPHSVDVLNYPRIEEFASVEVRQKSITPHLLYTGTVSEDRGALIYAELLRLLPGFEITIIGRCSRSVVKKMQAIAAEAKSRLHIHCSEDGVSFEQILDAYRHGSWLAGIAIFPPTPHYMEKELTKFFEYMAIGLPIISSDFPVWRRLILDTGVGICVDPNDLINAANSIQVFASNIDSIQSMSENGYKTVREQFCWESQANNLLMLYASLIKTSA